MLSRCLRGGYSRCFRVQGRFSEHGNAALASRCDLGRSDPEVLNHSDLWGVKLLLMCVFPLVRFFVFTSGSLRTKPLPNIDVLIVTCWECTFHVFMMRFCKSSWKVLLDYVLGVNQVSLGITCGVLKGEVPSSFSPLLPHESYKQISSFFFL